MLDKKILLTIVLLVSIGNIFALSNESIQAKDALLQSEKNIITMQEREIPTNRVNETYQDALQIYTAQLALEQNKKRADYKLVLEYTNSINQVKDISFRAKDELAIFIETYNQASTETDLSSYQESYQSILDSFNDERFEDTLVLINKGYNDIAEIQSSQTTTKVFYKATTDTIKNFLINNWLKISITIVVVIIILLIFWNGIVRWKLKKKLKHLIIEKNAIDGLMKKMQKDYFKDKKTSETEYRIKLKKFEELLREIEGQTMVTKAEFFKNERMNK